MSRVLLNEQLSEYRPLYRNGKSVLNKKETFGYRQDKTYLIKMLYELNLFCGGDHKAEAAREKLDSITVTPEYIAKRLEEIAQKIDQEQECQFLQSRRTQVQDFFYETNEELLATGKEELASLSGEDRRAALLRYARKTFNKDMETQLKILIEEYPVEE